MMSISPFDHKAVGDLFRQARRVQSHTSYIEAYDTRIQESLIKFMWNLRRFPSHIMYATGLTTVPCTLYIRK
jgi:uncharacterized membrane protein YdjX (TVP38/TMEM64 family)